MKTPMNIHGKTSGKKKTFEWWAVDKDGNKYHEYHTTKRARKGKAQLEIEAEYGFKVSECIDFDIRLHRYE
ncbi:MAG: hypothetical protein COB15_09580 [Flavobacteriales bacterium]|nr:MAG: hypothetical protein COB15_09580 [Flavobacteriales bacterium]